jgi:ankyrin repeat protein
MSGSFQTCDMLMNTMKHLFLQTQSFSEDQHSLVKQFLPLISKKNSHQRTPVHEAAKKENFPMLDFFFRAIDDGYLHNASTVCEDSDEQFRTSLHLAAAEGKAELSSFSSHR